jgi:hypothetical protein
MLHTRCNIALFELLELSKCAIYKTMNRSSVYPLFYEIPPSLNLLQVPGYPPSLHIICTFEFLVHLLNVFPLNQNSTPNRHHKMTNAIFVMIGGI